MLGATLLRGYNFYACCDKCCDWVRLMIQEEQRSRTRVSCFMASKKNIGEDINNTLALMNGTLGLRIMNSENQRSHRVGPKIDERTHVQLNRISDRSSQDSRTTKPGAKCSKVRSYLKEQKCLFQKT